MAFRVMARTLLHLGAELISSDGVAFYELVKNAFDARSPRVEIEVNEAIPYDVYVELAAEARGERDRWSQAPAFTKDPGERARRERATVGAFADKVASGLTATAPNAAAAAEALASVQTWEDLCAIVEELNYIEIRDTGSGMSRQDLLDVFLTIGTRSRLENPPGDRKPVLGEKGIGRLSVMRLGWTARIESTKAGEAHWNVLPIDWRRFSHDSDELIEDVHVEAVVGAAKSDPKASGTVVHVAALRARWSAQKLALIATEEFSRLTDPFVPRARFPVTLRFNGDIVPIPHIDKILFEQAHAVARLRYEVKKDDVALVGTVEYVARNRSKVVSLDVADLVGIAKCSPAVLRSVGPFSVEFYWYNRAALEAVESIGDKRAVQRLVNQWSGGLMLFRDGFRVNPYGSKEDDWLELDRKALASGGYKVNRKQIIGRVEISKDGNPALVDQTNREGLRDSDEKQALISILKHVLEREFRAFLNKVDDDVEARVPVTFDDVRARVDIEQKHVRRALRALLQKYPEVKDDPATSSVLTEAVGRITALLDEAQVLAESFQKGRRELVDLAGIGLMVEIVAHELSRASMHALESVSGIKADSLPRASADRLKTLRAQLKTLQKRLEILDPLGRAVRQGKESFDMVQWVRQILSSHEAQFERHQIECEVVVLPRATSSWPVKMVKGMVVQVLENLLSNSVYWLKLQKKLDKRFRPVVRLTLDVNQKTVAVWDNGPGVPKARVDEVFQAFVSTKPPGEGRGLGLYISREIAHYHNAELVLIDDPVVHKNRANTFRLELKGDAK